MRGYSGEGGEAGQQGRQQRPAAAPAAGPARAARSGARQRARSPAVMTLPPCAVMLGYWGDPAATAAAIDEVRARGQA